MASNEGIGSPFSTQPPARSVKLRIYEHVLLWDTHTIDDGTLYFTVPLTDKMSFCLLYVCDMFVVSTELTDGREGNCSGIREYMKRIPV
jgi:hypothetical protein